MAVESVNRGKLDVGVCRRLLHRRSRSISRNQRGAVFLAKRVAASESLELTSLGIV